MNRELIDALDDRAATYGLLARLYRREADAELIDLLAKLPENDCVEPDAANHGIQLMREYAMKHGAEAQTELAVDFARLFFVRTARTKSAPYPFESVYASENGTLMGDARDQVLAIYRNEGLGKGSENLPEDHISLELEFEQLMGMRTSEALRAQNETEAKRLLALQQAFLEQHLLSWAEPFTAALENMAETGFYQGLALFTKAHLEEDARFLADLLNLVHETR